MGGREGFVVIDRTQSAQKRRVVDGLVLDRQEVWVLLGSLDEDPVEWLLGDLEIDSDVPFRICRAVLDDGMLLIDDADPDHDQLLSQLLRRQDGGFA